MQDCAILIPTRNRPLFLQRLLRYLSERDVRQVMVVDGSDPSVRDTNREAALRAGVRYRSLPPEIYFWERVFVALDEIDTPYLLQVADDDFIVPETVVACCSMLRDRPDCVAVTGVGASFSLYGNAEYGDFNRLHVTRRDVSFRQADASDRVQAYLAGYWPVTYAVQRTSAVREALGAVIELGWHHSHLVNVGEILQGAAMAAQGTLGWVDGLLNIRQAIPTSAGEALKGTVSEYLGYVFSDRMHPIFTKLHELAQPASGREAMWDAVRSGFLTYFAALIPVLASPPPTMAPSARLARRAGIGGRAERAIKAALCLWEMRKLSPADKRALGIIKRACRAPAS